MQIKNNFKITYDPEADAMYIYLKKIKKGEVDHTKEVSNLVFVDVNKKNQPLGIEILNVSLRFGRDIIKEKVLKTKKVLGSIPVKILSYNARVVNV
jgi:uncharacterized protein YuzE